MLVFPFGFVYGFVPIFVLNLWDFGFPFGTSNKSYSELKKNKYIKNNLYII